MEDELTRMMLGALRPGPGHRCLDLGSGRGELARLLARRGAQVIGLDPRLGKGGRHGEVRRPARLTLLAGDAGALPLANGSMDRIVVRRVLHHVHDQEAALREIARVLKPGGLLAIIDGLAPALDKVQDFFHAAFDLRDGGPHVRFATLSRWRDSLAAAGLHLLRTEARVEFHEIAIWARHSNGDPAKKEALAAHFAAASPVVRSALRLTPPTGPVTGFAAVQSLLVARR